MSHRDINNYRSISETIDILREHEIKRDRITVSRWIKNKIIPAEFHFGIYVININDINRFIEQFKKEN